MSNIVPFQKVFEYQGKQVRTVLRDGEPWFVAKDVCDILELVNYRNAVSRLGPQMKGVHTVDTPGGPQQVTIVSEAGVYKLVFQSRKPEAERFTDWLAQEVIPSIRQHGAYLAKPMSIEDMIILQAQSVKELKARVDNLQQTVQWQAERLEDTRRGLVDVNAPLRHQFNKAIRDLALRSGMAFDKCYDHVYDLLSAQEHIDIKRRAQNRGVKPIDIVEQNDLLVKAIRLAKALGNRESA